MPYFWACVEFVLALIGIEISNDKISIFFIVYTCFRMLL
ncbi:hypothetical protein VCHA48O428_40321 [Vibrio chagasii]|nr:hypothetical protein VCHA48O428_40321 [Vibrio chagasii]